MRKILRCFCLGWLLPDSAHNWKGEVVNVADGDTINVRRGKETVRIRLYGVDCPESRQKYGSEATEFARKLILGKKVRVEAVDTDQYGRTVGLVYVGHKLLNRELIRAGCAWVYSSCCKKQPLCRELTKLEERARKKKVGLWRDKRPTPPREWRKKHHRSQRGD
ncbi:MAG: thermonuclease family protein [Candidatus Electrothrix scaldis]|nr:MAG: thermonuclease family protein [Candidatus Electrothrix sp. GW3-3]